MCVVDIIYIYYIYIHTHTYCMYVCMFYLVHMQHISSTCRIQMDQKPIANREQTTIFTCYEARSMPTLLPLQSLAVVSLLSTALKNGELLSKVQKLSGRVSSSPQQQLRTQKDITANHVLLACFASLCLLSFFSFHHIGLFPAPYACMVNFKGFHQSVITPPAKTSTAALSGECETM